MSVERARRRKANQKERAKLLALLGKRLPEAGEKKTGSDSDSDSDKGEDEQDQQMKGEQSDDSESESDDESAPQQQSGTDLLQSSSKLDIPIVKDIPILSQLAKQDKIRNQEKNHEKQEKKSHNKQMTDAVMDADELEVETHFVENPFIKTRERAHRKAIDSQQMLSAEQIMENDAEKMDIVRVDEKGKYIIRDLEQMETDEKNKKMKKRLRADVVGYGQGEDVDSDLEDDVNELKKKMKDSRQKRTGGADVPRPTAQAAPMRKRDAKAAGHIVKDSADKYKSIKGKGDMLKAGTHEPYAYIKLNPEMLHRKRKQQAVASFAGVVSHGKKVDKRTFKRKDGMLSGISAKKSS